ncbi:ABC transporter substrate-binding protein [Paenibacillus piri]|uniref:Extracellular solute-binding protein n=1 Tax=Paenibacillus piri TaxID=2547395 RepID=A0A4R5KUG2_9BACL|nr:extracellular solute-binding protein [Paenibacillus piri]TDF98685.1 extracellular solute-binding protein [Paenibacillus piri]
MKNSILKHPRLSLVLAGMLTVTGLIAGCGTTAKPGTDTASTPAPQAQAAQPAAESASKDFTLYVAESFDKALAKSFEEKTKIKVNIVHIATGDLIAKIQAERNNPHWDVAWFDGATSMQSLNKQGLLLKDWSPANVSNYTSLGKELIPSDRAFFPTHVTAAAAIAYNTNAVKKEQAPKDWSDLLKPEFKNSVAMNDPSVSGPTYPFVAGMLQQLGEAKGKQFFQDLKANGLKTFPKNPNTLQSLLTGATKAIMIQDTAILNSKTKGDPVEIVYPASGVPMLYGTIAVSPKSSRMDAAKQFVEYVLSPEAQKQMVDPKVGEADSYYLPIIQGVEMSPQRPTQEVKWLNVDVIKGSEAENELKKWFHDSIVQ